MPSHPPGHVPPHVPITATAIPFTAIAAMAATSEVPHTNPTSPWDGDDMPLEVLEVQECLAGPCRRVQAVLFLIGFDQLSLVTNRSPVPHC